MKQIKPSTLAFLPVVLLLGVAACDQQGPAERLGENADEATGQQGTLSEGPLEKTGESIDNAAENVGEAAEETRENVGEAAEESRENLSDNAPNPPNSGAN